MKRQHGGYSGYASGTEPKSKKGARETSYEGYKFPSKNNSNQRLDFVELNGIDAPTFYKEYVKTRKPVVLNGLPLGFANITPDLLLKRAGEAKVQVEKRLEVDEKFGQNRSASRQVEMAFRTFLHELKGPNKELFYLSTQSEDLDNINESGGSVDNERQTNIVRTPCRQLMKARDIPPTFPLAGNLVLQACNLWMGASIKSCSGLHHDFHDNFYVVVSGCKTIDLYPPDADIPTCGTIERVHANGLISYTDCPTRSDGVPLEVLSNTESQSSASIEDDDSVAEGVIGKGFDYTDESDEDDPFDGVDDFEALVGDEDGSEVVSRRSQRPNQFAAEDAAVRASPVTVAITAGQCLFLPASWFHSVTSSLDDSKGESVHMAFNYWFFPPDGERCESPYLDKFWSKQEADIKGPH